MHIKETNWGEVFTVHCVYWVDGVRHYYVILDSDANGFTALRDNCKIIDPSVPPNFVLIRNENGTDFLLNRALLEDNLLDRLIDHDPRAMEEYRATFAKT